MRAWEALAAHVGLSVEEAARQVMNIAIDKTMKTVNEMIEDYELDRSFVTLVGGGGSGRCSSRRWRSGSGSASRSRITRLTCRPSASPWRW